MAWQYFNQMAIFKPQQVASQPSDDDEAMCVICMDQCIDQKKLDKCGHVFCSQCINDYFQKSKKMCPSCGSSLFVQKIARLIISPFDLIGTMYGILTGNQPLNAKMDVRVLPNRSLPGHEPSNTVEITYTVPNGIQTVRLFEQIPQSNLLDWFHSWKNEHPSPGRPYAGTSRIAYLPDTAEGREVLALLRKAFDNRLIFTIGRSRTTNADNVVTWNDIHHKTAMNGGSTQ